MNNTSERKKRILIIEDEPDFAALLEYRLQRRGYETIKASDGRRGAEKAVLDTPDLIVLDLMLPQMAGLDVCRYIRSIPAMTHVPIFIMTALDSVGHKAKGFMFGANGYFTKGNQVPDLLREIDVLFAGGRPADTDAVPA
jgi:two-component system alkaline phosphatase synthesis response regulator PhoP